ncbi:alkaline-shock protein [Oenococcus oeni]|uniref:Alkaline-shock protein n=1 Tax=Oenococcus oeni TaxID=1247 RepID=A0A6N4A7T9_OENOE|nr:Asp23/Gls24 family envelope stress response protein [Oenococcus oeni]OIL37816.1 alkaline-shock protein [Oenococcus oeni]OIM21011.1 alkaline-shock protein [Oenococcus oeni]SYW20709.1 putative Alkaline shock protein Asp23 (module) [Oenococcus oeni]
MTKAQEAKYFVLGGSKLDGETKISSSTLETIASIAAKEIDGVIGLQAQTRERFSGFFFTKKYKQTKGVVVKQDEDGNLLFTVYAIFTYGVNIPKTALAIQNSVKSAISAATDLTVSDVDVVVSSLIHDKDVKPEIDPNNLFEEKKDQAKSKTTVKKQPAAKKRTSSRKSSRTSTVSSSKKTDPKKNTLKDN